MLRLKDGSWIRSQWVASVEVFKTEESFEPSGGVEEGEWAVRVQLRQTPNPVFVMFDEREQAESYRDWLADQCASLQPAN